MQFKGIKDWVKANKLLSVIIVGVIIVAIILYLGANKQVPAEQPAKEDAAKTPSEGLPEAPTEPAAPETVEESQEEPTIEETPIEPSKETTGEETKGKV